MKRAHRIVPLLRAAAVGALAVLGLSGASAPSMRPSGTGAICRAGGDAPLGVLRQTVRAALTDGGTLRLVALGSSSTAGAGASSPALGYVAQLEGQLNVAWGAAHVTVYNRGIGGDTLAMETARLKRDVLSVDPQVVIVQSGMNDVLQGVNVLDYSFRLKALVTQLQARHIAVVLVNNQFVSAQQGRAEYELLTGAQQLVGEQLGVPVISRLNLARALMRANEPLSQITAPDGLHPTDLMHRCTADALAQLLTRAAAGDAAPVSPTSVGTAPVGVLPGRSAQAGARP